MYIFIDPLFIGCCVLHNAELGNKVVTKEMPEERVGVYCWLKSKKDPSQPRQYGVVEYMELLPEEVYNS
jgi:UDP-N-acetylglucosamine pyrophosphorylase